MSKRSILVLNFRKRNKISDNLIHNKIPEVHFLRGFFIQFAYVKCQWYCLNLIKFQIRYLMWMYLQHRYYNPQRVV